jgi:hypothetical protein
VRAEAARTGRGWGRFATSPPRRSKKRRRGVGVCIAPSGSSVTRGRVFVLLTP